jgi:hypothetical protein
LCHIFEEKYFQRSIDIWIFRDILAYIKSTNTQETEKMISKILPIEVEAVATVKQVLADLNYDYVRKYCQILRRSGTPTGKRSHKFYGIYYNHRNEATLTMKELVLEINSALYFAAPGYAAFITKSLWYNIESISIRPIL